MAVGDACLSLLAPNCSGEHELIAESWNGTGWTIQPMPTPPGESELRGLSCASSTFCLAVGDYSAGGTPNIALAEEWDGSSWTIPNPPPPGVASKLDGVSCTSPTACVAVGTETIREGSAGFSLVLAEFWDGTRWAIKSVRNRSPLYAPDELNAVSCSSATACTAVGVLNASIPVETWNGSGWMIQPVANPPGAVSAQLSDVSCTSAAACTAVGVATKVVRLNNVDNALAEVCNGTSWATEAVSNPAVETSTRLTGIACTAATACIAVGTYSTNSGPTATTASSSQPLVERRRTRHRQRSKLLLSDPTSSKNNATGAQQTTPFRIMTEDLGLQLLADCYPNAPYSQAYVRSKPVEPCVRLEPRRTYQRAQAPRDVDA
jgi:hypothetical protein